MITVTEMVLLPAAAGLALGIFYFGGLWLTLRRLLDSKQPALLTLGSYLGRLAVCFAGFFLIARVGDWQGVLVCLLSFLLVRVALVRRWGKPEPAND